MSSTGGPRAALTGFGVLAVVAVGGAMVVVHNNSAHGGAHFVSGHAEPRDVTLRLAKPRNAGTSGGMIWSHTCAFDRDTVYVPVRASVADVSGWVTLHITAGVFDHATGEEVASATENLPMEGPGTSGMSGLSVNIPLAEDQWKRGVSDCAIIKWTMTPGAWFSNED